MTMFRFRVAVILVLTTCAANPSPAQERVSVRRADGHLTPLLVYAAYAAGSECPPFAVISHGAGGSEKGYRYLAQAMAQDGFTTIVMGHRESGLEALRSDVREDGLKQGVTALVTDTNAEAARLLDVGAALNWADAKCKAPFRVLLGHSMGSITVMLESGAKNRINVASPPAGQDRFDAYVALSPEGPGVLFPERAWNGIRKPMLILTGTRDLSLKGGPQARQIPWYELPGSQTNCQWMGVIDGATHMNFAGAGFGADRVDLIVTRTAAAFLSGVRTGKCVLPVSRAAMMLQAK